MVPRILLISLSIIMASAEQDLGHGMRTFPVFDQYLKEAQQLADKDRYDLASTLWQKVIDESRDAVITRPDWIQSFGEHDFRQFRPARAEVEGMLAGLSPAALRAYRLRADGEARALLQRAGTDPQKYEAALGQIANRYFLSSIGDNAADELAGLHLDRMEFLPALRLLGRILHSHPDPDVDMDQLLLRHAVATSRSGYVQEMQTALDALSQRGQVDASRFDRVSLHCREYGSDPGKSVAPLDGWGLWKGNVARNGISPSLPEAFYSAAKTLLWNHDYSSLHATGDVVPIRGQRDGELRNNWDQFKWYPNGQLRFSDDRMVFMGDHRVVCLNYKADKAPFAWLGGTHQFPADQASEVYFSWPGRPDHSFNQPIMPAEVATFGDQLHTDIVIDQRYAYSLEGPDAKLGEDQPQAALPGFGIRAPRINKALGRVRMNKLVATDITTGNTVWWRYATADHEPPSGKSPAGFLGAPVPYGDLLLVPILDGEDLWLHALDADHEGKRPWQEAGRTVWKSFLCKDDQVSLSRFSPIAIAVDGGEVFVLTGSGNLLALNALTGSLRWALAYPRSVQESREHRVFYDPYHRLAGWDRDTLLVHERNLIVMPSDFDGMFSIDRSNGKVLWQTARQHDEEGDRSRYCLGVHDGGLFVAGNRSLRRYDVSSGVLQWEANTRTSYGRALLTRELILYPEMDKVLLFETGIKRRFRGHLSLPLASDRHVGNLQTDGDRLFVVGMRNVSAYE